MYFLCTSVEGLLEGVHNTHTHTRARARERTHAHTPTPTDTDTHTHIFLPEYASRFETFRPLLLKFDPLLERISTAEERRNWTLTYHTYRKPFSVNMFQSLLCLVRKTIEQNPNKEVEM